MSNGSQPLTLPQRQWRAGLLTAWPIALVGAPWVMSMGEVPLCGFRHITGLPCPLCGGTRVCAALAQGDFQAAWQVNPGLLFVLAIVFLFSVQYAREAWTGHQARRWHLRPGWWQFAAVCLMAGWFWQLWQLN